MKNTHKKTALFVAILVSLPCFFVACAGKENVPSEEESYGITLLSEHKGKTLSVAETEINMYCNNAANPSYLARVLYDKGEMLKKDIIPTRLDHQKFSLGWTGSGEDETFTVHFADNADFANEFTYSTTNTSINNEVGIFTPDNTYYYKVTGSKSGTSKTDSFVCRAPVRFITADTVLNMRDLGGKTGLDNKKIKYGLLYRGGALNEGNSYLSDKAKKVFDYLGIKGELDLRGNDHGDGETGEYNENKIDPSYPILRSGLEYLTYDGLINNKSIASNNLPKIFCFLADESNYPVYFHCSVGADRTGTLAYLIGGLLGMSYDELMIDFELTTFSQLNTMGGIRARTNVELDTNNNAYFTEPLPVSTGFNKLGYTHALLTKRYSESTEVLSEAIEMYLLEMGVRQEHIDSFKEIMLG